MEANRLTPLGKKLASLDNGAQAELARHLDTSPATVNRWAKANVKPHRFYRKQIERWLKARGVEVKDGELWR